MRVTFVPVNFNVTHFTSLHFKTRSHTYITSVHSTSLHTLHIYVLYIIYIIYKIYIVCILFFFQSNTKMFIIPFNDDKFRPFWPSSDHRYIKLKRHVTCSIFRTSISSHMGSHLYQCPNLLRTLHFMPVI